MVFKELNEALTRLAHVGRYGIDWTGPQKDEDCKATETAFVPRGYGPKGVTRRKFSTAEWAKRDEVKNAWAELADEHGLTQKEIQDVDRVFGMTSSVC